MPWSSSDDLDRDIAALAAVVSKNWMMQPSTPVVMPAGLSAIFLDVTAAAKASSTAWKTYRHPNRAPCGDSTSKQNSRSPWSMGAAWAVASSYCPDGMIVKPDRVAETLAELVSDTLQNRK